MEGTRFNGNREFAKAEDFTIFFLTPWKQKLRILAAKREIQKIEKCPEAEPYHHRSSVCACVKQFLGSTKFVVHCGSNCREWVMSFVIILCAKTSALLPLSPKNWSGPETFDFPIPDRRNKTSAKLYRVNFKVDRSDSKTSAICLCKFS